MMKISRRQLPAPYIPFISLADIAWQIIIFFLIASTFLKSESLNVAMPTASPSPAAAMSKPIIVNASETALTVNGLAVPLPDLETRLTILLAGTTKEEQRAVVARFRDDLSFQRNAEVMYAIERAGGVVIVSEQPQALSAKGQAVGGGTAP